MSQRKSISKATRLKVYEKYSGHCAYCGCTLKLKDMQVDHIQSVYWYDGANDIENFNPACRMCNFYKSTRTVEDFKKELGKLLSRLEKVFIFRLAVKYGLIKKTDNLIEFYFENQNKTGFNSKRNAETVKHIIEVDGSKLNEATVCKMQEIKHGSWEYDSEGVGYANYLCSECGNFLTFYEGFDLYPYCPYCGVKMDRG